MNNKEELKIIELFSGIGAQVKGINKTNLFDVDVIATADLDKEVVVSYAAIHCGLTNEMVENYKDYPSKDKMVEQLTQKRLGYDFKKDKPYDWEKLSKKKDKTKGIEKYWLADNLAHNLGDITQISELPLCDLLTYSAPCTDWSIAGKQEGGEWTCKTCGTVYSPYDYKLEERYFCPNCKSNDIKSTRSGLLFEVERLLTKMVENGQAPKYLLCENVDALVSKKFKPAFDAWISTLSDLGYNTYWTLINAKNCGVPQNRNRLFAISIRQEIDRKQFEFPKPFDTGIRLRDVLETDESVIEKYFLSDEVQSRLQITDPKFEKNVVGTTKPEFRTIGQRDLVYQKDSIMGALVATDYKQPKQILETPNEPIHIADLCSEKFQRMHEQSRRVYSEDDIAPAMHTCGGGNTEPKVEQSVHSEWKQEMYENFVKDSDGVASGVYTNQSKTFGYRPPLKGFSKTLKANANDAGVVYEKCVRKLTPKEAHRLMGFDDVDYENCKAVGMSDTQGYKQSGNSIVTNVIALLAEHLYKAQYDESYICYDENFQKPQLG